MALQPFASKIILAPVLIALCGLCLGMLFGYVINSNEAIFADNITPKLAVKGDTEGIVLINNNESNTKAIALTQPLVFHEEVNDMSIEANSHAVRTVLVQLPDSMTVQDEFLVDAPPRVDVDVIYDKKEDMMENKVTSTIATAASGTGVGYRRSPMVAPALRQLLGKPLQWIKWWKQLLQHRWRDIIRIVLHVMERPTKQ